MFDRIGIAPTKEFYDCLCPARHWYAPSAYGACEGRTVAYGTVIHAPFTSDPAAWAACSASHLNKDGSDVLQTLVAKTVARPGGTKDYAGLLRECRSQYLAQQAGARARELYDGYDYLAQSGIPVLPPPESIAAEMKRDVRLELADLSKALGKAQQATDQGGADSVAAAVADKIFEIGDVQGELPDGRTDSTRRPGTRSPRQSQCAEQRPKQSEKVQEPVG